VLLWTSGVRTVRPFFRGGRVMPTLKDMSTYTTLTVNGLPVYGNNLVYTMNFPSLLRF
jgi:hypothetical protein